MERIALQAWLLIKDNELRVSFDLRGAALWGDKNYWHIALSNPVGSYMGSQGETLEETLDAVERELKDRFLGAQKTA